MKRIIILVLTVIFLSVLVEGGNYSAYDGTMEWLDSDGYGYSADYEIGAGHGWVALDDDGWGWLIWEIDGYCSSACSYGAYFSVKYAGNTSFKLNTNYGTSDTPRLYGIDLDTDYTYDLTNCGILGDDYNMSYPATNCSSNIGWYYIDVSGVGDVNLWINLSRSNVTYTGIEDIVYDAGQVIHSPIITKFRNDTAGGVSIRSTYIQVDGATLYNTNNNNQYNEVVYDLTCSGDGINTLDYYDYLVPTFAEEQIYYKNIYINPLEELNVSMYTPYENPIYVALGERVNFTVVPSIGSRVDNVGWYYDMGRSCLGCAFNVTSGYNVSFIATEIGEHLIEGQLEDNNCGDYPTVNWTIIVGEYVQLGGVVYKNNSGSISRLEGAEVNIVGVDTIIINKNIITSRII